MSDDLIEREFRERILGLVSEYADRYHSRRDFVAGESVVPVSGRVYDAKEMVSLVDSALDFWLTTGRFNDEFESRLSEFLQVKHVMTVNSGSSANLLAVTALTSPLLGDRALKPGDEVITVAAGFPTTVNPIIQNRLVPVFVDVDIPTYNIDAEKIEAAITDKTRAIIVAHTLGNPFDLDKVTAIAKRHRLWLIEDCCDALGSIYKDKRVGGFGDIATFSFYPAHHITMGEGGAVATNNGVLKRILTSLRDWGRDCHCDTGCDNSCGKRFDKQYGQLPQGYDHKYVYSHVGYNLKITDMQAAVGVAQLDSLTSFVSQRRNNFNYLRERLVPASDRLILPVATPQSVPSWFGFPVTLQEGVGISRTALLKYLDEHRVATRLLFGGNLIKQPYFSGLNYRVSGDLVNTDTIMERTFWIGIFPGLSEAMLDYSADTLIAALNKMML